MSGNDAPRTDIAELLPAGLTDEEANFVYNAEVLGLPMRKAASMAGSRRSAVAAAVPVAAEPEETVSLSSGGCNNSMRR